MKKSKFTEEQMVRRFINPGEAGSNVTYFVILDLTRLA